MARVHVYEIAQLHPQVVARHTVQADLAVLRLLVAQHNEHRVTALFAADQHSVTAEQAQLVHLGGRQARHRVVVGGRLLDEQTVRRCKVSATRPPHRTVHTLLVPKDRQRRVLRLVLRRWDMSTFHHLCDSVQMLRDFGQISPMSRGGNWECSNSDHPDVVGAHVRVALGFMPITP